MGGNQSTSSIIHKVSKLLTKNKCEQFARPVFNFGDLPWEIQEMILMKAAVERRLASKTFGEVFASLAPVCKLWREMMSSEKFYERVQRQTFLKDPTLRYLHTVQSQPVIGVQDYIICVATLGDQLYVAELEWDSRSARIVKYNLDDRAPCHDVRGKRKIVCSKRLALEVEGLHGTPELMVSCPRTNTLYILEHDWHGDRNANILQVDAVDGTVLRRLDLGLRYVNDLCLNLTGSYMVITTSIEAFIYDTTTGALVKTIYQTNANSFKHESFATSVLLNGSLDSFFTILSSSRQGGWNKKKLVLDDHQCRLLLSHSRFKLYENYTDRSRKLRIKKSAIKGINITNTWYDKDRGLLFCPHNTAGLKVLRVTY